MERIKQIIRTLQPAAEIIECDYANADLDKIIYTEAFDFERTATSAGWIRGIESALTEEQKKKEAEEHEHHHHDEEHAHIIIMKVVKWMNMASVLLCIIVVRLFSDIHKFDRFVSTQWSRNIIRAKGVCYFSNNRDMSFLLNRPVCRKS